MTKDEALKLALEALKCMKGYGDVFLHRRHEQNPYDQVCEAIAALEEVLAQPAQEPVALVIDGVLVKSALPEKYTGHLYTAPQQRPWVGLTDKEINDHRLSLDYDIEDLPDPWDFKQGFRAAERAYGIKEKNT